MIARAGAYTLPDDGIIDAIAVGIAASGIRPVALTPAERQAAAARILACGGTCTLVCKRLHVSGTTARALAASSPKSQAVSSPATWRMPAARRRASNE
jgi:hypothetical protein